MNLEADVANLLDQRRALETETQSLSEHYRAQQKLLANAEADERVRSRKAPLQPLPEDDYHDLPPLPPERISSLRPAAVSTDFPPNSEPPRAAQ